MANLNTYRFSQSDLTLKPGKVSGQSALCLVYADSRTYQDALDNAGVVWSTTVTAVNDKTAIVALTLDGITRSASGEDTDFMSAEARAFKRACVRLGTLPVQHQPGLAALRRQTLRPSCLYCA
jgi:hypothetical protein